MLTIEMLRSYGKWMRELGYKDSHTMFPEKNDKEAEKLLY